MSRVGLRILRKVRSIQNRRPGVFLQEVGLPTPATLRVMHRRSMKITFLFGCDTALRLRGNFGPPGSRASECRKIFEDSPGTVTTSLNRRLAPTHAISCSAQTNP